METRAKTRMRKFADIIGQVPAEIFDFICSYLNWKDLENCHYVCHAWRKRTLSTTAWKQICINEGYKVTAKASDIPSYRGDKPLSYRELFYRLKYREENWMSSLETKVGKMYDGEHMEVDKGLLAYVDDDRVTRIADVEVYDCAKEKLTFQKEGVEFVYSLHLLDGVLILRYRNQGFVTLSSWDAHTGDMICEEYEYILPYNYSLFFDICNRELNILVGHDTGSGGGGRQGNMLMWNLTSGELLYQRTREPGCSTNSDREFKLCAQPNINDPNQNSFYIIWDDIEFRFGITYLRALQFRSDTLEELDEVGYTMRRFHYDDWHTGKLYVPTVVHQGKVRIMCMTRTHAEATEKGSTLGGREVALDFRTDEDREASCFLQDPTDDSQDYNYIGTTFSLNPLCSVSFMSVGNVYEMINHSTAIDRDGSIYPALVHEIEIFKIEQSAIGNKSRHLVVRFQWARDWISYSSSVVDYSWLDGLDGENDSGLFMIIGNPYGEYSYRHILTRIYWGDLKRLKQRAVLD